MDQLKLQCIWPLFGGAAESPTAAMCLFYKNSDSIFPNEGKKHSNT